MPTATFTIDDFSLRSSWTVYVSPNPPHGNLKTTPTTDAITKYYTVSGIPAGSAITSAVLKSTLNTPTTGIAYCAVELESSGKNSAFSTGSLTCTSLIKASFDAGDLSISARYRFRANGNTTSVGDKNSTLSFSANTLEITYTLPYSNCTPASAVSVSPTSTGKSKPATLSWSGAGGGTNNAITGYQLWRSTSATSGYATLGEKILATATSGTATVTSHATNGSKYYYKVSTYGTQSGYDSGQSSSYATLTTTWTEPTPPNSVTGPTNVVPGSTQKMSWSGASGGTNNPITGYELYYSGDSYAASIASTNASTTCANVTAHATSGSSYTYKVKVLTALSGVMSTASHTMTSLRGVVSAPTSVSFSKNNVAPGEPVSLSWSGQSGGTNNAIQKFEIETSTNGTTYTKLGEHAQSPYSPITASASNGGKIYARVKVVGEVGSATSAAATVTTTVTKPSPPSTISINDNNDVLYSAQRTLSWSGAGPGTNNAIKGYRVMLSVDGGAYAQLGSDILTSATSHSIQVAAKSSNGYHNYAIHALGDTVITAEQVSALSGSAKLTTLVTNPTAPTTVTVPTNVAPGSTQSLSWSGADNGTNNDITTYDIYEKAGTGAWEKINSDGASPYSTLTAHTSNGGTKSYYIIAVGTSGRGDSPASKTVTMTTTVSKPGAPTTLSIANNTNTPANADRTLTWSGATPGTYNNPIKGYRVLLSVDGGAYAQYGADIVDPATTAMTVKTKNGNGVHSYKVITLGSTLNVNSDQSTATATLTTVVTAPSAPTAVSVADGAAVPPGATRTLSWSGAGPGTNNAIKGYQVRRSADGGSFADFGSAILTTATSGTLSVIAPATDGTYSYKVKTLGDTLSMHSGDSSAVGTLSAQKIKSTASLNKTSLTATGSQSISATITQQTGMSYSHEVTWYIPSTACTSGVLALAAGALVSSYTVPQTWIDATTKTTTSVTAKCKVETFDGTASLGSNEYSFVVNVPGKSTITLSKQSVDITGAAPGDNAVTISTNYGGYKHSVTWSANATYKTTRVVAASGNPTDTCTFPITWNHAAPNASSFSITCSVQTIKVTADGDMDLGSSSIVFQGNVPSSIIPTVTSITPSKVTPYWDLYVQGKSKCQLTPVAAGTYSSTIVSYEITWPTNKSSGVLPYTAGTSWTSDILGAAGSIVYTVKVTDSRGRSATKAASAITVTDYSPPSITGAGFVRCTSGGTVDHASGTYIKATAKLSYSAIGSNAITAKAYYQEGGTSTWLPADGIVITVPAGGVTSTIYGGGAIAMAKTYQTKIVLSDAFTTVEQLGQVSTVTRVFDLREDRAGFGRIASATKELSIPSDWDFVKGLTKVSYAGHTHTKASITDFPSSMPASDVSAWAKAATKPDYSWSDIGSKPSTFAPSAHNHTKANITDFPTSMPASDVSAWAKAATKPAYTHTEVGAAASSHSHSYLPLSGGALTGDITQSAANSIQAGSFARLTSWASQLDGKAYMWHIHLDGTNAILGYTNDVGTRTVYTLTHSHPYAASSHSHSYAPLTGGGTSGSWPISVTGSSASCTGNAASASDASKLDGRSLSDASTATTVAGRNSSGDILARLFRSEYANQATISGAIAFRTNNSTDNYIRFCSDAAAIRTFIGAQVAGSYAASSHTHDYAASNHTHAYVPTSRTVNSKALSANISLTAADVGAAASSHTHSYLSTSGGTVSGTLYVTSPTAVGTVAVRKMAGGTALPTTGVADGDVFIKY